MTAPLSFFMNPIHATFVGALILSLQITLAFILILNRIDALEKKLTEKKREE